MAAEGENRKVKDSVFVEPVRQGRNGQGEFYITLQRPARDKP